MIASINSQLVQGHKEGTGLRKMHRTDARKDARTQSNFKCYTPSALRSTASLPWKLAYDWSMRCYHCAAAAFGEGTGQPPRALRRDSRWSELVKNVMAVS